MHASGSRAAAPSCLHQAAWVQPTCNAPRWCSVDRILTHTATAAPRLPCSCGSTSLCSEALSEPGPLAEISRSQGRGLGSMLVLQPALGVAAYAYPSTKPESLPLSLASQGAPAPCTHIHALQVATPSRPKQRQQHPAEPVPGGRRGPPQCIAPAMHHPLTDTPCRWSPLKTQAKATTPCRACTRGSPGGPHNA